MKGSAARHLRTFREIIDSLDEHLTGQVIGGRLIVLPRPGPAHLSATGALGRRVGGPFHDGDGGPGGWWILQEPELSLALDPDFDPVVPDLAGWRRSRLPHLPETAAFALAPDWVCEVLSPSTEVHDRAEKMPFYARAGVEHAWLVDPAARTLEAFRRDGSVFRPIARHEGNAVVRVEPFDAVAIDLGTLWVR